MTRPTALPAPLFVVLPDTEAKDPPPTVTTFSIVAADPATGEVGVAVQSKLLAVGAAVPWANAGVGAVATQAWANTTYGSRGLHLLAAGKSPDEAIKELTANDAERENRQVGIVGAASTTVTGISASTPTPNPSGNSSASMTSTSVSSPRPRIRPQTRTREKASEPVPPPSARIPERQREPRCGNLPDKTRRR